MRKTRAMLAATAATLLAVTPIEVAASHDGDHNPSHEHEHEHEHGHDDEHDHDRSGVLAEVGDLLIEDGFARAASAQARSGAGYFTVTNRGEEADVLTAVESPAAARVELHSHGLDETGVARMSELAEGIEVPAGETVTLAPGGLHVMFMGLTEDWSAEGGVAVTLVFERAGPVDMVLPPVDAAPGSRTRR